MMRFTWPGYLSFVEKVAALLLLIYPTLMFAVKGGMNGAFLFMLLLAFAVWIARPVGMAAVVWKRKWAIYAVAMAAMSAAILISQSYHQNYASHPHDAASRYLLAIPVFFLLQRLRLNVFSVLEFSFPMAAIIGLLLVKHIGLGRFGISTLDLIHFGDFELILGILSLFSINWLGRDKLPIRILKILGFTAGLAASLASGSRGGWLAIPVFIFIFIHFRKTRIFSRMIVFTLLTVILSVTLLYSFNGLFHQRVNEFTSDVTMLKQGNPDTSMGIRWQLYKAATHLIAHHPLFGVGPEGFALEMNLMVTEGNITPKAAVLGRAEVHNDILSKTVGMGVIGLLALLAIYIVPFRLFLQATHSVSEQVKRTGILGLTFVSGFFIFGLSAEILNLTVAAAFYSFTVAVLLAACYNIHHGDQTSSIHPFKKGCTDD